MRLLPLMVPMMVLTACAAPVTFEAPLGAPPPSLAMGGLWAVLTPDTSALSLTVEAKHLSGPVTGAILHGPEAPAITTWMPGPTLLKGGVTLTDQQAAALKAGQWSIAIQTANHPDGEITGAIRKSE